MSSVPGQRVIALRTLGAILTRARAGPDRLGPYQPPFPSRCRDVEAINDNPLHMTKLNANSIEVRALSSKLPHPLTICTVRLHRLSMIPCCSIPFSEMMFPAVLYACIRYNDVLVRDVPACVLSPSALLHRFLVDLDGSLLLRMALDAPQETVLLAVLECIATLLSPPHGLPALHAGPREVTPSALRL